MADLKRSCSVEIPDTSHLGSAGSVQASSGQASAQARDDSPAYPKSSRIQDDPMKSPTNECRSHTNIPGRNDRYRWALDCDAESTHDGNQRSDLHANSAAWADE